MILGILGFLASVSYFLAGLGFPLSLTGLILAAVGKKKGGGGGMATVGLVFSILGLVACLIIAAVFVIMLAVAGWGAAVEEFGGRF